MAMMKKVMCLACLMTIAACGQTNQPGIDKQPVVGEPYQSECLSGAWGYGENSDSIEILVDGDAVSIIDHYAEFNCCLDAWMEVSIEGNQITVVEKEDPDKSGACYCICPFELSIEVSNLADGTYLVEVFREDYDGLTKLFEQSVQIPADIDPECIDDGDCPDGQVCRQNRCEEEPPVDQCLQAGGSCLPETTAGCPSGTHQLPPDTFVCGGVGGVICCVPGCLSDSDCNWGEFCEAGTCVPVVNCEHHDDCGPERMCVEGGCVEVNVECIDYSGYCFPVEGEWACQCYEPGDSRLCHDVDLAVACTDALQLCCSEEVEPECETHEDCGAAESLSWCIRGECLEGPTPCQAAGGICTIESECPEGFYSVKDPSYMNCGWCGYCCLSSGCPDLIDCPAGTTCQADGTCQVDVE
ncbi:MAG: hypothetical protein JRJ19_01455 [Deltaproteobacteria bacterium]|nr:hypothetical protein [Deltaproteobacteria bacterium]MBW1870699.1 hypothetical protein [Deltaproteobacteria bacterium]